MRDYTLENMGSFLRVEVVESCDMVEFSTAMQKKKAMTEREFSYTRRI